MESEFLTVRLSEDDVRVVERLRQKTGLSKSDVVKHALRSLDQTDALTPAGGLFELGAALFGRYGNARRQSSDIKRVVKARLRAKRARR